MEVFRRHFWGPGLFCCVSFAVSFKEVALGFQPPLEQWAFSYNHHWFPKGLMIEIGKKTIIVMVVEAQGLIILVRETIFSAAQVWLSAPLRFCTRNTESCQVLTGPLGGGRTAAVCYVYVGLYKEKIKWVGGGLTSFGMAYFSGVFVKLTWFPNMKVWMIQMMFPF